MKAGITTGVISLLLAWLAPAAALQDAPRAMRLQMEVALDKTSLTFRGENISSSAIEKGMLGVRTNRVHMLRPDGSVYVRSSIVDKVPVGEMGALQPGEQITWTLRLDNLADDMNHPGEYRFYWEFGRDRSNVVIVNQPDRPSTTRRTTQPAKFRQSTRTPKASLQSFYMSYDGDGRIESFVTYDDAKANEVEAVLALNLRAAASAEFKKWVGIQFGAEGRSVGWFYESMESDIIERIEKATVTYDEYFREATVQLGEKGWSVRLVRTGLRDNEWKVSVTTFMRDGKIDWRIPMETKILEKERERIADGVYKTIRDAREAAREQFWAPGGPKLKD